MTYWAPCRSQKFDIIILFSESDIHALEILKNQNLLVLGREGIEINPDLKEMTDSEV